jgi:hypothetical protein
LVRRSLSPAEAAGVSTKGNEGWSPSGIGGAVSCCCCTGKDACAD